MGSGIPSYKETGIITVEELKHLGLMPPEERLTRGPVAIPECPEEIPCNICVVSCPQHAISIEGIKGLPRIDWDKCVGCGVCVAKCPGLAIFVVDLSKPGEHAYVTVPHEFLPAPKVGDVVDLLSREGEVVGRGEVVKVWESNRTWVVTVRVPRELAMEVRGVWVRKE